MGDSHQQHYTQIIASHTGLPLTAKIYMLMAEGSTQDIDFVADHIGAATAVFLWGCVCNPTFSSSWRLSLRESLAPAADVLARFTALVLAHSILLELVVFLPAHGQL